LISAVLNVDDRMTKRKVATVDVSDTRHIGRTFRSYERQ
jgi:hypothetical protein